MNKRITSILFCLAMAVVMMLSAVPASASSEPASFNSAYTVTADKTTASPGEEITITLALNADSGLAGFQAILNLPVGLTYVDRSGKVDATAKAALTSEELFYGWYGEDECQYLSLSWTNSSCVLLAVPNGYPYNAAFDMTLLTFKVKVDEDATAGSELTVTFTDIETVSMLKADGATMYTIAAHTPTITPVTITVAGASVPATSISLSKTETSIKEMQTETLVATVVPSNSTDKVVWTSGDTTIATVDESGKVTAVKYGSTTITATAGTVSATCKVNVECIHGSGDEFSAVESTCTQQGHDEYTVCGGCGKMLDAEGNVINKIPYRPLKAHDFTKEEKADKYLKTAGDCKNEAVYYYSCSVCGLSEENDNHTFKGAKNPDKHVEEEPILVNAKEADHKNGINGYTGDKVCPGCKVVLEEGTPILSGAHRAGDNWIYDTTDHWKECSIAGCGTIITDTKENHSSTGKNVATCQHAAVCDVCGCTYGECAEHDYTDEKKSTEALKSKATCTVEAVYYYSCTICGAVEKNDEHTFNGDKAEHSYIPGYDTNAHYSRCENCGATINMEVHIFVWKIDKQATATEKGLKHEECACGYAKAGVEIDPIPPVTTAPVTTAPVTTAPVTTAPVTTAPVTTAPETTAPTTEAPVTTAPETGDVPETDAPKTGSSVAIAAVLVAVSGAAVYVIGSKRKKEN